MQKTISAIAKSGISVFFAFAPVYVHVVQIKIHFSIHIFIYLLLSVASSLISF